MMRQESKGTTNFNLILKIWKVKRLFVVKLSKMTLIKSKSLKNPKKDIDGLWLLQGLWPQVHHYENQTLY
jgi:hypothetical protein